MDDANSETGLEARRTASNAARRHGSRQGGINGDDAGSLRPRRRTSVEAEEEEEKGDDDFRAATNLFMNVSAEGEAASTGAPTSSSPERPAASRHGTGKRRSPAAVGPAPTLCCDPETTRGSCQIKGAVEGERQRNTTSMPWPQDHAAQQSREAAPLHPESSLGLPARELSTTPMIGGAGGTPTGATGGADLWGREGMESVTKARRRWNHRIHAPGDMEEKWKAGKKHE